jgi:hypothetical protein
MSLLTCLILSLTSLGAEAPSIQGPADSAAGDLVFLQVVGLPEGADVSWEIAPPVAARRYAPVNGRRAVVFAAREPMRVYFFAAVAIDGRAIALQHILDNGEAGPDPPEPDRNPYPAPSAELRAQIKPILAHRLSRDHASLFAQVHARTLADVRAGTVTATGELRAALVSYGKPLGLKGRYQGWAQTLEAVAEAVLGKPERELVERDQAALEALCWAIWETGRPP